MTKQNKPILFFDLETTGIDINKDRIVQIGIIKRYSKFNTESFNIIINPEIEIPQEATDVHGISNEDVKNAPTLKDVSSKIKSLFSDCIVSGFNSNRFDIPLLINEMNRVGVKDFDISISDTVDVMRMYKHCYPNTLVDIYRRLTGKDFENAHDAMADITATQKVFDILSSKFENMEDIIEKTNGDAVNNVDFCGFLKNEDGNYIIQKGKYSGKDISILLKDENYLNWFYGKSEFPSNTKKAVYVKLNEIKNDKKD